MAMEWISLELKVISCSDIKAFNLFQKPSVYAAVSITNNEELKKKERLQRQKTPIDRQGGVNPEWNHTVLFDLKALVDDYSNLFVSFDLNCEGVVYGNRTIGKVRVPLEDLIDEFNGAVRFLSYQVRTCDGKPNGVLHLSYKVKGKTKNDGESASPEGNLSPGVQYSTDEKVNYPSLEVDDQSQKSSYYPSLDDVRSDPLPGFCFPSPKLEHKTRDLPGFCFPSPKLEHKTTEVYGMTPPPSLPLQQQRSTPLMAASQYCHPFLLTGYQTQCPLQFVQTPGHMFQSTGYGGLPGIGQSRTVDGRFDWVRRS